MISQFTTAQVKNFKQYVKIQRSGKFNMFDPRARSKTKQSAEEWVFNIQNYEALAKAVQEEKK
jgi:hypothetical protein